MAFFFQSCKTDGQSIKGLPKDEFLARLQADLPVGTSKDKVLSYLEINEIDFRDNSVISTHMDEEFVTCVVPQKSLIYSNYKIAAEFYFDKQTKNLTRIRVFE